MPFLGMGYLLPVTFPCRRKSVAEGKPAVRPVASRTAGFSFWHQGNVCCGGCRIFDKMVIFVPVLIINQQSTMANMETKELLESVAGIVRSASALMQDVSFEVTEKAGYANIVTSSDVAVQDYLCGQLAELLPGSGFLCEEKDLRDDTHEYVWIIDPIDGTANYSRGIADCAICVGLKHREEMVLGVVYLPRSEEMFTAEKGKGAFLNGHPIHVSGRPFANALMCTALPVYHKAYAEVCAGIIGEAFQACNDIRRFGACAPELCYLAAGRCELYFEYLLSAWDYAAASLILTEAGGVVTALDGGPVSLGKGGGVLAANHVANHRQLLEIVQRHLV